MTTPNTPEQEKLQSDEETEPLSNCCGANPQGEVVGMEGRCADCKEMALFSTEEEIE